MTDDGAHESGRPERARSLLELVAATYAGGCLCIALVDLRVVQTVDPQGMADLFASMLRSMGWLMLPQLIVIAALMLWLLRQKQLRTSRRFWVPLSLLVTIALITRIVHIPINRAILGGLVREDQVMALVTRWDTWHFVRTALALALPWAVRFGLRREPASARAGEHERRAPLEHSS